MREDITKHRSREVVGIHPRRYRPTRVVGEASTSGPTLTLDDAAVGRMVGAPVSDWGWSWRRFCGSSSGCSRVSTMRRRTSRPTSTPGHLRCSADTRSLPQRHLLPLLRWPLVLNHFLLRRRTTIEKGSANVRWVRDSAF